MSSDDRAQFEQHKRDQALALGNDARVFAAATDLFAATSPYDYSYLWSWMGIPIIQMPADIVATQEVVWSTKPDIIIETGVARGGSVVFMAALLKLIGKGKVIGVDIDIRAHNRESIECHPMAKRVVLVEGSIRRGDDASNRPRHINTQLPGLSPKKKLFSKIITAPNMCWRKSAATH